MTVKEDVSNPVNYTLKQRMLTGRASVMTAEGERMLQTGFRGSLTNIIQQKNTQAPNKYLVMINYPTLSVYGDEMSVNEWLSVC